MSITAKKAERLIEKAIIEAIKKDKNLVKAKFYLKRSSDEIFLFVTFNKFVKKNDKAVWSFSTNEDSQATWKTFKNAFAEFALRYKKNGKFSLSDIVWVKVS